MNSWDMRSPELTGTDHAGALEIAARRALNGDYVEFRGVVRGHKRRLPPAIAGSRSRCPQSHCRTTGCDDRLDVG